MSPHALVLDLGYVGAALGVVMVVPQIIRTLRHPTLGGVSPVAWSMTALACLTWLTYGVRTSILQQIPGNVLLVVGAAAVVLLVPSGTSRRRRAMTLGAVAVGLLAVAFALPPPAVGYLAVSIGLVSAWPQVYDSLATWRAGTRSGVSLTTWALKAVSQLCWLSYAIAATDIPVTISATVSLSTAVTLVTLESLAPVRGARAVRALQAEVA
jgi:uncharacterized protein with PQ loop repeat